MRAYSFVGGWKSHGYETLGVDTADVPDFARFCLRKRDGDFWQPVSLENGEALDVVILAQVTFGSPPGDVVPYSYRGPLDGCRTYAPDAPLADARREGDMQLQRGRYMIWSRGAWRSFTAEANI
jgi:hypothetical protein